jgi:hypothetical protein
MYLLSPEVSEMRRREKQKYYIAKFFKNVLPDRPHPAVLPKIESLDRTPPVKWRVVKFLHSTSFENVYESTPKRPKFEIEVDNDDNDDDNDAAEEEVKDFGRKNFGEIASPYLKPYLYLRPFLDKQYGIRRDIGRFMIGNSTLSVDDASNMSLKGRHFKGTKRIRDLSRKNVYKAVITTRSEEI